MLQMCREWFCIILFILLTDSTVSGYSMLLIKCFEINYCTLHKSMVLLFSALTLLVGRQEGHPAHKNLYVGLLMVTVWLELCTSYSCSCHPPPPSSSCFNKIQNGDIPVPANLSPPGKWSFEHTERKRPKSKIVIIDVITGCCVGRSMRRRMATAGNCCCSIPCIGTWAV